MENQEINVQMVGYLSQSPKKTEILKIYNISGENRHSSQQTIKELNKL